MTVIEKPTLVDRSKCFGGWVEFYKHLSICCRHEMRFSVYIPPQAEKRKVPILYWLPSMRCNADTFMRESGAGQIASKHGLMLVAPDSSPRGLNFNGGNGFRAELGEGATFYVNAIKTPWSLHIRMFDYITQELPTIVKTFFPALPNREGIFGFEMGGHGALIAALRNPERYLSISAFSPISSASQSQWGRKAFTYLLGPEESKWLDYDACHLISQTHASFPILVDQGTDDQFISSELMPELLKSSCSIKGIPLNLRMQEGHDHSYFFVLSFMQDHIEYHAQQLNLF